MKREDADAEGTRESAHTRRTQTRTPEEEVDVKKEAAEVKRASGQTAHVPAPKEAHGGGGGGGGYAQCAYDGLDWQRAYEEAERLQDQERAFGAYASSLRPHTSYTSSFRPHTLVASYTSTAYEEAVAPAGPRKGLRCVCTLQFTLLY